MTALGKLLRGGRPWASRQHWAEEGKRNFAAHVLNDLYGPKSSPAKRGGKRSVAKVIMNGSFALSRAC